MTGVKVFKMLSWHAQANTQCLHTTKNEPLCEHTREIAAAASYMLLVQIIIPSPHL